MAYIGPAPNPGQNREVDDISSGFNGGTASFTLQVNGQNVSPGSANAIVVSLGGVIQNPGTDYTIAASTITFTTNPASGLSFFGLVLGQGVDTGVPSDGSVTLSKFVNGTASNNGKFLRANNGAAPSFETVAAGTSLSGSTNNTVTTVTGADAIQGEANLTFDGTKLGIGTTSADGNLHVQKASAGLVTASTTGNIAVFEDSASNGISILTPNTERGNIFFGSIGTNGEIESSIQYAHESVSTSADRRCMIFKVNGNTERWRISNTTFRSVGQKSDLTAKGISLEESSVGGRIYIARNNNDFVAEFFRSGSRVGTINITQFGTGFNQTSDYRLKENVVDLSDGITRLKTLKPKRFNFIIDETNTVVDGFLAHEVTAVPEAVTGTKDEVDSDNKPVYQGIDQSKLVPLLTAALQEAVTKIETLETKVAALEAA